MNRIATLSLAATLTLLLSACGSEPEDQPLEGRAPGGADAETSASAQQPTSVPSGERVDVSYETGEELFNHYCFHCHTEGDGKPGTAMLAQKHGVEKSIIKGRQDLPAVYIKTVVRNGLLEMAPFRFTEISDDQLELIAEYVRTP